MHSHSPAMMTFLPAPGDRGLPFFAIPVQCPVTISIQKQPFTSDEDNALARLVQQHGSKNWCKIAEYLPNRTPKQCRERWHNHLDPTIIRGPWSEKEDLIIAQKRAVLGNKWAEIATFLPGRNDTLVKNRWNTSVKARVSVDLSGTVSVLPPVLRKPPEELRQVPNSDILAWLDEFNGGTGAGSHPFLSAGMPPLVTRTRNFE
jgi:hypothetical protein